MNIEQETQNYLQSVLELEEMLEGECLCESTHINVEGTPCTIFATHRAMIKCHHRILLLCMSMAVHAISFSEGGKNNVCMDCKNPASECWTVTSL